MLCYGAGLCWVFQQVDVQCSGIAHIEGVNDVFSNHFGFELHLKSSMGPFNNFYFSVISLWFKTKPPSTNCCGECCHTALL